MLKARHFALVACAAMLGLAPVSGCMVVGGAIGFQKDQDMRGHGTGGTVIFGGAGALGDISLVGPTAAWAANGSKDFGANYWDGAGIAAVVDLCIFVAFLIFD